MHRLALAAILAALVALALVTLIGSGRRGELGPSPTHESDRREATPAERATAPAGVGDALTSAGKEVSFEFAEPLRGPATVILWHTSVTLDAEGVERERHTKHVDTRELEAGASRATLTDVRPGDYTLTSSRYEGDQVHVSRHGITIEERSQTVYEEDGAGTHVLHVRGRAKDTVLSGVALPRAERNGLQQIGMTVPLTGPSLTLRGLDSAQGKLYFHVGDPIDAELRACRFDLTQSDTIVLDEVLGH